MQLSLRWFPPFAVVCVVLALAGCSTVSMAPQQTTLAADRVELPTVKVSEWLLIDARINGAGPFRLGVDTGTTWLVLSSAVMREAALKPLTFSGHEMIGVLGSMKATAARVERLEAGGLKLEGVVASIGSESDFANFRRAGLRLDGFLGMAALKDAVLEMDFARGQVSVAKPGTQPYSPAAAVEYRLNQGGIPEVTVDVNGKPVTVVIDTGWNGIMSLPDLDGLPLVFPKIRLDGVGRIGIGSARGGRAEQGQLKGEVRLGSVIWRNPPLIKGRKLGAGAFADFNLAIDQHAQRIYFLGADLTSAWAEAKPPEFQFKPGFFGQIDGTGIRLSEVDAGGAFDRAGLRVGDVVLTVGGVPAAEFKMGDEPAATKRKLLVKREGREFETTVIVGSENAPK